MTEHIQVSKNTRLTITPDAEPSNPRLTDCVTGCYKPLNGYRPFDGPPPIHTFPAPIQDAHDRLYDYRQWEPASNVARWARINYGLALVLDESCYWFVDRNAWNNLVGIEFTLSNQQQVIQTDIEAWRRFVERRAEVVTIERRATYQRITPSRVNEDGLLHVWEPIESFADVYVEDYDGSYARVITDNFPDLTKKERTVFQAILDSEAVQNSEIG